MNKVFFLPFDPDHFAYQKSRNEYGDGNVAGALKVDVDHQAGKNDGNRFVVSWYRPNKQAPFIQSLNTGQLYIRGHGSAGEDCIESTGGGEKISSEQLADRLVSSGLQKAYSGKIKFFNCHSAEQGPNGEAAFAQRAADLLFNRGFKSCTFYGYVGPIDRHVKDGPAGVHHYRRDFVKDINGDSVQTTLGRASENRHQIFPNVAVVPNPGVLGKLRQLFKK